MTRFARYLAPAVVVALAAPAAPAADLDDFAAKLEAKAPEIIAHAKKKGLKNLGVLKFLVRQGTDEPRDDVGDLNLSLANKTEVALILANTDEKFGIIDKASEFVVREKMASANHRSEEGRRAFFTRKFDLAWSREKVEPGGFVTGLATLAPDLKSMSVRFQVFDKSGVVNDLPGELTAAADPEMLAQAGFSYAFPKDKQKALVAGEPLPAREAKGEAVAAILAAATKPAPANPAAPEEPFAPLADCPVKWTVRYGTTDVKVTGNRVPEPKPTDRVSFVLSNPGPGTYAAVLLVNGENTLYQERAAPLDCRKWVLTPGTEVVVRGFQTDADTVSPFKVLRPEESEPDAVRYGDHAGTFRLVVYHGKTSKTNPERIADAPPAGANGLAIARTRGNTLPPGVKPQSLKALQAELRGRMKPTDGARGFVVKGGEAEKFETTAIYFTPSTDVPVADISLRYFTPKK